jgi:hypothetical protein
LIPFFFSTVVGIVFIGVEVTLIAIELVVRRTVTIERFMHSTYRSYAVAITINAGIQLLQIGSSDAISTQPNAVELCTVTTMSGILMIGIGIIELCCFVRANTTRH